MAVSKQQREDFVNGRKAYSPMQAAIMFCKTGHWPHWLDSKPRKYVEEFWQMEKLNKRTV